MRLKQQGFTLIELMVVVAVMAVMAAVALPNMSQWLAARKIAGQAEQVANLMRFARAEAVRLNAPVYVCPVQVKADGNIDQYCSSNADHSQQGIAAYADIDRNGSYDRRTADIALRAVILNPTGTSSLRYQAQAADGTAVRMMGFLPNGNFGYRSATGNRLVWGANSVRLSFSRAADEKQEHAVSLLVDRSGRIGFCERDDTRSACQTKKDE